MAYVWVPEGRPVHRPPWPVRHARWLVLMLAVVLCGGYLIGWALWAGPRAGESVWIDPAGPTATSDEGVTLTILQMKRTEVVNDPYTGLESTPPEGTVFFDVELEASSQVEMIQALSCRPKLADRDHREWEAKYDAVRDEQGQELPRDCYGVEPLGPTPVRYWVRYEVPVRHADQIIGAAVPLDDHRVQVITP
ncbi:hypothetical protein ACQCX2_12955 [Propionibacteriaceae bacterium Y1700]|uniref:hypothetical protein n=1 Tax=Microlunatus sp. Y1700 TaxID=3418487 RepID=UPI003DA77989